MQTDAEVAAKLTAPQKRVLLDHDDRVHSRAGIHHEVLRALYNKALIADVYAGELIFFRLTDLGLRVAQHLKQENAK